jgi:hypothetical protein
MQLRDLKLSDLVILEKDNLPPLFNGPFKLIKSIDDNGDLVGSFWVRITTEVSLLLKPEMSRIKRARAISKIAEFLYDKIPEDLGISDSFITFEGDFDEKYIKLLKKHFNFEEVRTLRVRRNDV